MLLSLKCHGEDKKFFNVEGANVFISIKLLKHIFGQEVVTC